MKDGFDTNLMSDEEAESLKFEPPITDEMETTPTGEEKVETKETPAPEVKVETPTPKPKPEVTEPKVETPKVEPPEHIDGIITKDGKNFIPFSVLEEERAQSKALKAEIEHLKKQPPPPPKGEIKEEIKEEKPPVDFKGLAGKLAKKAYESEEGMAEALEEFGKTLFEEGIKAGAKVTTETVDRSVEEKAVVRDYEKHALELKKNNPWIKDRAERYLVMRAYEEIAERKISPTDLQGLIQVANDVLEEGKAIFASPKVDLKTEIEKAQNEAYQKGIKDTLAKFNIKEEVPTLGDVKSLNQDSISKLDEIEKLTGIDYEEAYAQLTPQEREALLRRSV